MGDDDGPDLSMFDFGDDDDAAGAAQGPPSGESRSAMQKRHRQEEQQLRTEAKAKQRSISKGDRAARQVAEDELEAALQAMRTRQAEELGGDDAGSLEGSVAGMIISPSAKPSGGKKKSKKQKAEEAERAREQRIADHHAGAGPSEREIEMGKLEEQLGPAGLCVADIPADGHCLYRSLAHQMQLHGGEAMDFAQCRTDIAAYIRSHTNDFEPYLAADGCYDVAAYCATVESSSEWGGQLEITAFAHAKKRLVTVYSAGVPPLHTGEEYRADGVEALELSFHRHYYGLGAHYNALVRA